MEFKTGPCVSPPHSQPDHLPHQIQPRFPTAESHTFGILSVIWFSQIPAQINPALARFTSWAFGSFGNGSSAALPLGDFGFMRININFRETEFFPQPAWTL